MAPLGTTTPRAGILRALGYAVVTVAAIGFLTWAVDRMVDRGGPRSVEPGEPMVPSERPTESVREGSVRALAPGDVLPASAEPRVLTASVPEPRPAVAGDDDLDVWGGVPLSVVDRAGQPIAGAVANAVGYRLWPVPRTDANGFVVVETDRRPGQVSVQALGHAQVTVDVPAEIEGPLLVVLERRHGLRVRLVTRQPEWLERLFLGLASPDPLFRQRQENRLLAHEAGWLPALETSSADGSLAIYEVGADGVVEIDGLRSASSIEMSVLDCYGHVLHTEPLPVRADVGLQEVVVVVPGAPRDWSGSVVDSEGRPLSGMTVHIDAPLFSIGGAGIGPQCAEARTETDADGRFELERIWVSSGNVWVLSPRSALTPQQHPARQEWHDVRFDRWRELELTSSRSFEVIVRDEAGTRVQASITVEGSQDGLVAAVEPLARGHFRVDGATLGPCLVRASVAGLEYEGTIEPDETELVITTPVHGSLDVTVVTSPQAVPCSSFYVCVRDLTDGNELGKATSEPSPGSSTFVKWTLLAPGDYEAWLETRELDAQTHELRRERLSPKVLVTIVAGGRAATTLAIDS